MNRLPLELSSHIVSFCDLRDWLSLACVNRTLRTLCATNIRKLLERHEPNILVSKDTLMNVPLSFVSSAQVHTEIHRARYYHRILLYRKRIFGPCKQYNRLYDASVKPAVSKFIDSVETLFSGTSERVWFWFDGVAHVDIITKLIQLLPLRIVYRYRDYDRTIFIVGFDKDRILYKYKE